MSAKHTPAPWTAKNDGRNIISIQHSNNDPGAISMTLAKVTARMTWRSQAEANARLIAAAPDLLEALKACDEAMSYMSEYDIPITLQDMVKAAIAKAIG